MKRIVMLAVAGTLAAPAIALADKPDSQPNAPTPSQSCKTQRSEMGARAFADLYGTSRNKRNAFGKCVSRQARAHEQAASEARENAPARCREEQAADPAAFDQKYGTNRNKRNAFGKCVSAQSAEQAQEQIAEQDRAVVNAARTCARERAADPAAFAQKYGTNRSKRNAFGKCVSKQRPPAQASAA